MVDQNIVNYIRQYLGQGYDINSVKSALLRYGYNPQDVEDAINSVYGKPAVPEVKHVVGLSKGVVIGGIAIFAVIVILAVVGVFLLRAPGAGEMLLDVSVSLDESKYLAGEDISFNVEVLNAGADRRYDVSLEYSIEDSKGSVIERKSETKAIEVRLNFDGSIAVPEDIEPGRYYLRTAARIDGQAPDATASFTVYEESEVPTCTDGIQNQGEEDVDCGGPCDECASCSDGVKNQGEGGVDCGGPCDACIECVEVVCKNVNLVDGVCVYTDISGACCGNNVCDPGETANSCRADCRGVEVADTGDLRPIGVIRLAEEQAVTDYNGAGALCQSLGDQKDRDSCFKKVAAASELIIFCSHIEKQLTRDGCYVDFAINGDYSGCDKIEDRNYKNNCNSMKLVTGGQIGVSG